MRLLGVLDIIASSFYSQSLIMLSLFGCLCCGSGLRWWVGAAAKPKKALLLLDSCWRAALKFHKSQMSASKICGCKRKILVLWLLVIDVKLFLVFLTSLTGFLQLLRAHRRFSELNSDSRNLRKSSCPAGSLRASSREKPHFFTRCWLGSLLEKVGKKPS